MSFFKSLFNDPPPPTKINRGHIVATIHFVDSDETLKLDFKGEGGKWEYFSPWRKWISTGSDASYHFDKFKRLLGQEKFFRANGVYYPLHRIKEIEVDEKEHWVMIEGVEQ